MPLACSSEPANALNPRRVPATYLVVNGVAAPGHLAEIRPSIVISNSVNMINVVLGNIPPQSTETPTCGLDSWHSQLLSEYSPRYAERQRHHQA